MDSGASPVRESMDLSGLIQTLFSAMTQSPMRDKAGGYPDDIFMNLTPEEREKYECAICLMVAKMPRQCTNGHLFCATCLFTWSMTPHGRNKCPVCRDSGRYAPNFEAEQALNRKYVKCHMSSCQWAGLLRDYKVHKHTYMFGENAPPLTSTENLPQMQSQRLSDQAAPSVTRLPYHVVSPRTRFSTDSSATAGNSAPADDTVDDRSIPADNTAASPRVGAAHASQAALLARRSRMHNTRITDRRQRLQESFRSFAAELERRQRHIDQHYRAQENRRLESLREVETLGRRLDTVSRNLSDLLGDMTSDSERYRNYIEEMDSLSEVEHRRGAADPPAVVSGMSPRIRSPRLSFPAARTSPSVARNTGQDRAEHFRDRLEQYQERS